MACGGDISAASGERRAAACLGVWTAESKVAAPVTSGCGGRAAAEGCKARCSAAPGRGRKASLLYLDRFINFILLATPLRIVFGIPLSRARKLEIDL
jgi:hypothetical protein